MPEDRTLASKCHYHNLSDTTDSDRCQRPEHYVQTTYSNRDYKRLLTISDQKVCFQVSLICSRSTKLQKKAETFRHKKAWWSYCYQKGHCDTIKILSMTVRNVSQFGATFTSHNILYLLASACTIRILSSLKAAIDYRPACVR